MDCASNPEVDTKKLATVSYKLTDELKEIIYREMITAQNVSLNAHCISFQTTYTQYHVRLDNYLKRHGLQRASKSDYLAFILLLTYSEDNVRAFTSFEDMKLAFQSDESDFRIVDIKLNKNYDNDDDGDNNENIDQNDCICSYNRIKNIYILENKFTNLRIQVGCECIKRYGLVSKADLDSYRRRMDELQENQREREAGLPIGYHKNLKLEQKACKRENKNMGAEDRLSNKVEKIYRKQMEVYNKKTTKDQTLFHAKCYKCKVHCLFTPFYNRRIPICSNCVLLSNQELHRNLMRTIKVDVGLECNNCERSYANIHGNDLLCKLCDSTLNVASCVICNAMFMRDKTSNIKVCESCTNIMKTCSMCDSLYVPKIVNGQLHTNRNQCNTYNNKCNTCETNLANGIVTKKCSYTDCKAVFLAKTTETWKKCCGDCYKKNMVSVNCLSCGQTYKRFTSETWKTKCRDCYTN